MAAPGDYQPFYTARWGFRSPTTGGYKFATSHPMCPSTPLTDVGGLSLRGLVGSRAARDCLVSESGPGVTVVFLVSQFWGGSRLGQSCANPGNWFHSAPRGDAELHHTCRSAAAAVQFSIFASRPRMRRI